jgi:hypothetical protein
LAHNMYDGHPLHSTYSLAESMFLCIRSFNGRKSTLQRWLIARIKNQPEGKMPKFLTVRMSRCWYWIWDDTYSSASEVQTRVIVKAGAGFG